MASETRPDSRPGSIEIGGLAGGVLGLTTGVPGMLEPSRGFSGNLIRNSEPLFGPSVEVRSHHKLPPITCESPLATSSPKPKPSRFRVRDSSSLENGSKMRGKKSLGIPSPVSAIVNNTKRHAGLMMAAVRLILPSRVNLTALLNTRESNLTRALLSTANSH